MTNSTSSNPRLSRREIARRCAGMLWEGAYINVGIGIPGLVPEYVPNDREVIFHSENGVLGVGPAPAEDARDPDLINAGKEPITLVRGGAFFHHSDAFMMIRGGHIDLALMGAFQVSENGDLANWRTLDDERAPAVGGAMDLAVGAKTVWILMEHTASDRSARVLTECTYPVTALRVVKRIFTELADISVTDAGLVVTAIVDGLKPAELQARTQARLTFARDLECMPVSP